MAASNNRLREQAMWIGAGPGTLDDATLVFPGQLGMIYENAGKSYQLVKFVSTTTTIANGTPVMWQDYDDFVVSAKVADSKRNQIAGVALGTQTAGSYGFIQVTGPHSAVICTGTFASGDTAIMSATDGTAAVVAAGTASTYVPLGIATAADSSSTVAIQIRVPLNM